MSISKQLGATKEVHLEQGVIRYRERGSGQPIVFVHGLLTNGDLWRKVVPSLAEHYRCITPDWPLGSHEQALAPGADLTTPGLARLIADFLTALGLEDVTLVANDTGGALCQLVVTQHPERIARLVLTSCDAFEVFPPPLFRFLTWTPWLPGGVFITAQLLRLRALRGLPITYGWVMKRTPEPAVSDSYALPAATNAAVRADLKRVLRGTSSAYTIAAARKLVEFQGPVLIAWAADDRLFSQELGTRLCRAFRDARLERIADCRTFVPEDQPERLSELIAGFMREPRKKPLAVATRG